MFAPDGQRTWTVPLIGDAGYCLRVHQSHWPLAPVRWELTSNHPDFEPRAKTVPLGSFSRSGRVWTKSAFHNRLAMTEPTLIAFPNQIVPYTPHEETLQLLGTSPRLALDTLTLTGWVQRETARQSYEIVFEMRLESEGLACVTAEHAKRLMERARTNRTLANLQYEHASDGKYIPRLPEPAPKRRKTTAFGE